MANIVVIGPGAIGATIAVRLIGKSRHSVTVCSRSPLARLTIDTADGPMAVTPNVLVSPREAGPCDWILVATKAYDVASAAAWFPRMMGARTRVAVLQNGVEHVARLEPYVPRDRIVPVVVDMPVERVAPGHFRQRREGRLTVAAGENGDEFARLFLGSGIGASAAPDFLSVAWGKLALNCAGALSALVLRPAIIAHDPAIAEVMRSLVRECVAVGRAEGAHLDDGLVDTVVDAYRNGPGDAINSLHADRIAGRRIEIDARNGAIVRLGRKHAVDTPVNQVVVSLLEAAAAS